jgi:outer membrane usher protein FimD/PapC
MNGENSSRFTRKTGYGLVVIGACMAALGVFFVWQAHTTAWVAVEATVNSVKVQTSVRDAGDAARRHLIYYPKVGYRYSVAGVEYESTRFRLNSEFPAHSERSAALAAALKYRSGDAINAFYSQKNPTIAVLEESVEWDNYVALLLGAVFAGFGYALVRVTRDI